MARTAWKHDNGKTTLDEYVVTVRMDHFVTVKAASPEIASSRGLRAAVDRWGAGLNPEITEIEKVTRDDG